MKTAKTSVKLALLLAVVWAGCGGTRAADPANAPASGAPLSAAPLSAAPALELVETSPVETSLGHAELRDAAAVWLEMIEGATRSIALAQFYASNAPGSRLEPIVVALEQAAARGVRVRFLAEQKFVKLYPDTLDRLAKAGAAVRHYDRAAKGGGILHAKYFVIDGREAFLGSQNFDWRALEHIYELGARVWEPEAVRGLAAIFEADWASVGAPGSGSGSEPGSGSGSESEPASGSGSDSGSEPASVSVSLVASPPQHLPVGVAWDLPQLVAMIEGATSSVEIQLLTYKAGDEAAPWDELEAPLVRAAARGVKVHLLVADWSKRAKTVAGLQRLARTSKLELRFLSLPAWSGGFIPFARVGHAKLMVVDGARGWLGTSNWERNYFYESRNVGLLVRDPKIVAQLATFFATAWRSPYAAPIDPAASYTPPRVE